MRFRKNTTYNSYDTQYTREGNRLTINHGVKHRVELALNGVIRSGSQGTTPTKLTQALNSRLGAKYSVSDISYALERLVKNNLIVRQNASDDKQNQVYTATKNALNKWRNLPKTLV